MKFAREGYTQVTVYDTDLAINGSFKKPDIEVRNLEEVLWDEAFVTVGVSDMKGIKDEIKIAFNNTALSVEPGSKINQIINTGITGNRRQH